MDGVPLLLTSQHPQTTQHHKEKQNPRQRKLSGVLHIVKAKAYFLS